MKILIVEDEIDLSTTISSFLTNEGNNVQTADSYKKAVSILSRNVFDLVLIDITLPDGNGIDLIKIVKQSNKNSGIIIVSARDKIGQKVEGLEKGADDYITKPFHLSELNARIKSLMRRNSNENSNKLTHNEIIMDLSSFQVFVNNIEIKLTKTEFELLNFFMSNKERVLTKISISKHVSITLAYEYNFSDDFIYTHVKNLRKKLLKANSKDYIKTIYGIGYKFISF